MPIIVACRCGKKYRVSESNSGSRVKCPACGSLIPVTDITETSALTNSPEPHGDLMSQTPECNSALSEARPVDGSALEGSSQASAGVSLHDHSVASSDPETTAFRITLGCVLLLVGILNAYWFCWTLSGSPESLISDVVLLIAGFGSDFNIDEKSLINFARTNKIFLSSVFLALSLPALIGGILQLFFKDPSLKLLRFVSLRRTIGDSTKFDQIDARLKKNSHNLSRYLSVFAVWHLTFGWAVFALGFGDKNAVLERILYALIVLGLFPGIMASYIWFGKKWILAICFIIWSLFFGLVLAASWSFLSPPAGYELKWHVLRTAYFISYGIFALMAASCIRLRLR